ncbi:unnamed protein product [Ectocarpus sp. 12 AP-2014]
MFTCVACRRYSPSPLLPHILVLSPPLCAKRFQVYGMTCRDEEYSPYHNWTNSAHELAQMMTYNVSGLAECTGSSGSGVK